MAKNVLVWTAFAAGVVLLSAGCASIIHGGSQTVSVDSTPSDAKVTVYDGDGQVVSKVQTPCTMSLKRGGGYLKRARYRLVFEKEGYRTEEFRMQGDVCPWYVFGNLPWFVIFPLPIGYLGVDPATGAMWQLAPERRTVALASADAGPEPFPQPVPRPRPREPEPNPPKLPPGPTYVQRDVIKGVRWAVVIGISDYRDPRVPRLRYAAADARAFHGWLIDPKGGGYAPSRVKLLLNRDATADKMRQALFSWSKQALEEDLLVVYFAGHGSPESPDTEKNLFLLPYDADFEEVAATGFPMWDIETALKRFIRAKKVVVVADACHAGGVGASFGVGRRAVKVVPGKVTAGLQQLSKVGDGVAVLTASSARQLSQESYKWGGGHGVFTHFLLKGLRGGGDYNKDGCVTLGELIPYVSENVRRVTKSVQTPEVAGKFDPALSLGR